MTKEMGKPIKQSKQEVDNCIAICQYTAQNGPEMLKDESRDFDGGKGIITYQPLGVILGIEPWNFPLYQVVRYSVPNLLAGNTTVLKHAKNVWGSAKLIQQVYLDAGIPEGAFGLLFLDNEDMEDIIAHEKIQGVTLTGSEGAGKAVAKTAGANLKRTLLELGGSDPYIILEDADLNSAVEICVQGRVNNSGQTCVAAKRFIIVEQIYDEFKEKFTAAMKAVSYGNPTDPESDMGPMARKDLRDDLHEQVQESVKKGAICLLGGEIPDQKGFFYPPTVLENVTPGMPAYDDELFGPVATLFKVKDEEGAIKIANDHKYGLGGGVFSADEDRAKKVALKIETGMVNINGYALAKPNLPFGGIKNSGYGREHGGFGIREFLNTKTLVVSKT